ncbi:COG1470 family protein [Crocosphaera sp.]|uniref:COG1470 family protein n=1 Tax=Crocosphaera sp. TaxID=2729996 RepID=UPI003F2434A4|nr:hypothetical protein [Crocosphaera sp.]
MTQAEPTREELNQQQNGLDFPLGVIRNPSSQVSIIAGETFYLSVTVANKGQDSVVLTLTIEDPGEMLPQCCVSPQTAFGIEAEQTREFIFKFDIPIDALPKVYSYRLKLDIFSEDVLPPSYYQGQLPKFYRGEVRVLPTIEQTRDLNDPTFTISPLTRSDNPLEVLGGDLTPFTLTIHNRSNQVDRFYLSCDDLSDDWFKVIYPDAATVGGMITSSDGLELNPGQKGQIQFFLTLPATIKAGRYSPTLQILSTNYGDNLALFDLIHLKVLPLYQVDWQLITQVGTVIDKPGWYEIRLDNQGNTNRKLQLEVIDTEGDRLCQYRLDRTIVELYPQEQTLVNLHIIPPHPWKRPFTGRAFNFTVEVRDLQGLPLPISRLPGVLLWKQRPWWHLYLCILGILLLLAGLMGLGWWLLTKKPPNPQVSRFTPQNNRYDAIDNQVIRLNWQIAHPQQLATLQLMGVSPEGEVLSQPISYDFSQGIPDSLQEFCSLDQTLLCTNVPTDGFKAGNYRFQLTLTPKGDPPTPLPPVTTSLISISPIPQPALSQLTATNTKYIEGVKDGIKLNWTVDNFRFIKQLILSVRSTDSKKPFEEKVTIVQPTSSKPLPTSCTLQQNQLVCHDFPTEVKDVGKFVFQLTLVPLHNLHHSPVSVQSEPIEVTAKPVPIEILQFNVDGNPTPPSYQVNLEKKQAISLQWQVKGDNTLKVELLPAPGTVEPSGGLVYNLSREPKTETLQLTAIDAQGQTKTRSVIIETYLPSPSTTTTPGETGGNVNTPNSATGGNGQATSPSGTLSESETTEGDELTIPPPPMTTDPQFR